MEQQKSKNLFFGSTLLVAGVIGLVVLGLIGGTVAAAFSNRNIFFFSEVVEAGEKIMFNATKESLTDSSSAFYSTASFVAGDETLDAILASDEEALEEIFNSEGESSVYALSGNVKVTAKGQVDGVTFDSEAVAQGYVSDQEENQEIDMNFDFQLETDSEFPSEVLVVDGNIDLKLVDNMMYIRPNDGTATFEGETVTFADVLEADQLDKYFSFDVEDELEQEDDDVDLDEEDIELIKAVITSETLVNNFERTDDQVFDGVRARCYSIDLDGQEMVGVFEDISVHMQDAGYDELDELSGEKQYEITDEEKEEIEKMFEMLKLDWCTGRQDDMTYLLDFQSKLNLEDVDGSFTEGDNLEFRFLLETSDPNVDKDVDVPADSETINGDEFLGL